MIINQITAATPQASAACTTSPKFGFTPITLPPLQLPPAAAVEKPFDPKIKTVYHSRGINLPNFFLLDPIGISEVTQTLLLQDAVKQGKSTHLKLFLNGVISAGFLPQLAMADTLRLTQSPVDIVLQKFATPASNFILQSTPGNRFIVPDASITVGPNLKLSFRSQRFRDSQINRKLSNDYLNSYEELIMARSGETSRKKVNDDITSETSLNPLEALAYGKKGMVDGILIGHNQVITRSDLDAYYKQQGFNAKQIEHFNHDVSNIYKVPSSAVQQSFPHFLPTEPEKIYEPPKPFIERLLGIEANGTGGAPPNPLMALMGPRAIKKQEPVSLISEQQRISKFPNIMTTMGHQLEPHVALENNGVLPSSVFQNDTLFLNGSINRFNMSSLNQAAIKLADKRYQGLTDQNIKLVINSPGGIVSNGFLDLSKELALPIDTVVNGIAASMGAMFSICTTGKRFATPNSIIMIHEHSSTNGIKVGDAENRAKDDEARMYKELCQKLSKATGRELKEVVQDTSRDFYVNPLEAILYGKKGMIDAILVGPDEMITRQDVEDHLTQYFGSKDKLYAELEKQFSKKREPLNLVEKWKPEDHDEKDPFENPLRTINAIAATRKKKIASVAGFEKSGPSTAKSIDIMQVPHFNIDRILDQIGDPDISAKAKHDLEQQLDHKVRQQQGTPQLPQHLMG